MSLGCPQPSGERHWPLLFTPATDFSPQHSQTALHMRLSIEPSQIRLCFMFGAVLPMCSSRRTSDHLGALGPTWRSVSSLNTLRAARAGSFTTLSPRRWLFQKELTLMSTTSCFRGTLLPTSLPLILTCSLRLP